REHAVVVEHADELLGVERVASGMFEQPCVRLDGEDGFAQKRREQARGVLVAERGERDSARVPLAAAPARTTLVQLGPPGAEDEERHAAGPVDEMLDKRQQRVVRPVDSLEKEHKRPLRHTAPDEAAPRSERLLAVARSRYLSCADQWSEAR